MSIFSEYQHVFTTLAIISGVSFVLSLITLPWLVSKIPTDYFCDERRPSTATQNKHPILRIALLLGKNILGGILLIGGFIMLFIPGQGLLTIAMGLLLMNYPGKFQFEKKIAGRPEILKGLNWLREKAHTEPLIIDQDHKTTGPTEP